MAPGDPFAWHLHLFWTVTVVVVVLGAVVAGRHRYRATRRQMCRCGLGLAALFVAGTWPLADLAAHWSLLALVVQRLLLLLAVPPLLVTGLPPSLLRRVTRPALVDAMLGLFVKPLPSIGVVTVVCIATLTTGPVGWTAGSAAARAAIQIVMLATGFVLWAPVLTELPGVQPLSAVGRGAYLIVQSILPSFLSVVWIFARRPLYASYDHPGRVLGMAPVLDQQLAGFVAKLGTVAVLWTVAFVIMTRAPQGVGPHADGEAPLVWADVEREISRAERRARRRRVEVADPDRD